MNRELRIFLITVGVPALILALAGAWLLHVEWRSGSRHLEDRMEMRHPGGPPSPKNSDDVWGSKWIDEPEPGHELGPGPGHKPGPERGPDPRHEPGHEDRHHEPPIPWLRRVASENYGISGERIVLIAGCIAGLLLLSLVSGGWLLMRSARRARKEALEQTDFVSNISHEFKTPLTTICLCAELAQDEGIDPSRRMKALQAIQSESERLKRLVLNALDFSRLEKHRRHYDIRPVDVAELARETCASFSARFADGQLHPPEGNCTALADADAVRQILTNLLDNAAKYAPGGEVEVVAAKSVGQVCVMVSDRGPGLSQDALRHGFDRFWRGDNSVTREIGGSGLGLAIARCLARGMGGELRSANRKDGGAVFTLELKA